MKKFTQKKYSTEYFDRSGNLLFVSPLEEGLHRQFISIKDLPKPVQKAFIQSEDRNFNFHFGIDFVSVFRAFFQNVSTGRRVSGASTITMQLARMISPSEKRNFSAKMKDSFNALRLESRFSKKKILELYLNSVPFGNNVEGISSAARLYFSKEVKDLTLEEIRILSVIPRRPSVYNPVSNPKICAEIAEELYGGDFEKFFMTAKSARKNKWPFFMPHYIKFITENSLFQSEKTKVILSADLLLHEFLEQQISESLEKNSSSRIENAAAIVIENKTGKILSWVGSGNWFDESRGGQIDGVLVKNQMGSSMKPFLYAIALENGFSVNSVLPDIPTEFMVDVENQFNSYRPENFNNRFNGPVLFRNALASSLNIPAVYILSEIGVERYLSCLFELGFDSLRNGGLKAGLGLSLGAGEVSLKELTHAFSVFANDGILVPLEFEENSKAKSVFHSETARLICDILSDKKARVTGFGYNQTYETDYPSIFKTGTANQYQNIVALGSTRDFTVGVWMGNFSGNTVVGKTGSSLPAKVAKETLDFLTGKKSEDFQKPSMKKTQICPLSGLKAGKNCPSSILEYGKDDFIENGKICNWHKIDGNSNLVTEFPAIYQGWISRDFYNSSINYKTSSLKITSPKNRSLFYISDFRPDSQKIPVEIIGGKSDLEEIRIFYDEKEFRVKRPFSFFIPVEKGFHTLKAVFGDETDSVEFQVM